MENNKFIMLTKNAYIVVTALETNRNNPSLREVVYSLTTILPRQMWSRRRAKLLEPWSTRLADTGKGIADRINVQPILILSPATLAKGDSNGLSFSEMSLTLG